MYFKINALSKQDRFHDSSRVVLLICLNLHSMLRAEKVWEYMRKVLIDIFFSTNDTFLVCRKK